MPPYGLTLIVPRYFITNPHGAGGNKPNKPFMKRFICGLLAICSLASCTKTIYTHEQVLSRSQTKDDVIRQYGIPADQRSSNGYTQFVYNYGEQTIGTAYGRRNTNASVSAYGNTAYGNSSTNAFGITSVNTYSKYIQFVFDKNDRVVTWESQGVNMAEKKPAPFKTVLYILGCIGAGVAFGMASGGDL